jgi:hypothetical protein
LKCAAAARPRLRLEVLEARTLPSVSPIDVVGHLSPADYNQFIANALNFQGNPYKDWGNEPSIAVNPTDPNKIVVATFAYGVFMQAPPGDTLSSVWYSTDGGADWGIRFPILSQTPAPGQRGPNDQTIAYDGNGVLHAVFLTYNMSGGPALNIYHGTTADPNADGVNGRPANAWHWDPNTVNLYLKSINHADQPWLALSNDGHAYVAYGSYDDSGKNGSGSLQVRVSASADNGANFTADNIIISSNNGGFPDSANPGVRLATDKVGDVYSIYGYGDPPFPSHGQITNMHYRLNMSSDGGQTWNFTDSGDKAGGLVIDDGLSLQIGSSFGGVDRLTGDISAIAADPTGAHVYAVYGKEDTTGTDRLYLAEFHPDGFGGLVERGNPIAFSVLGQRSALPSIAVTDNGTVAVQYDTFTDADGQFHVHLAVSTDQGQSFTDQDLYDFTASGVPYAFPGQARLFGDYQDLIALGNAVYGTFAGRGNVQHPTTGIDTTDKIDPFYYSVTLPGGHLNSLTPSIPAAPAGWSADMSVGGYGTGSAMGAAILGAVPFTAPGTAAIQTAWAASSGAIFSSAGTGLTGAEAASAAPIASAAPAAAHVTVPTAVVLSPAADGGGGGGDMVSDRADDQPLDQSAPAAAPAVPLEAASPAQYRVAPVPATGSEPPAAPASAADPVVVPVRRHAPTAPAAAPPPAADAAKPGPTSKMAFALAGLLLAFVPHRRGKAASREGRERRSAL